MPQANPPEPHIEALDRVADAIARLRSLAYRSPAQAPGLLAELLMLRERLDALANYIELMSSANSGRPARSAQPAQPSPPAAAAAATA
jgi:hypothetical protein